MSKASVTLQGCDDSAAFRSLMPDDLAAQARSALTDLVGRPTEFRDGQLDAIVALVRDRQRVLCVQRTGWGKSAVYFVATRLLRSQGAGPTLLVSPLLALMRNQIEHAQRGGIRAVTINSDNQDDWDSIYDVIDGDAVDLLIVSPERFANPKFRATVLPKLVDRAGLFVIDEAHCISDWGHDFRPDYRRFAQVLRMLPPDVPVLCTTATANDRVVADVVEQLGDDLVVLRGQLERESLALDVVQLSSQAQRLAWLAAAIPTIEGSGIVYTLTVRDAVLVSEWLVANGIAAAAYFGGEESANKQAIEERLKHNQLKAVVATSALGMGYDKPDLAFVIHFQSPGSAIAYYQQVGRAGRALPNAVGVLLSGEEDERIQNWFINTAFPAQDHAEAIVAMLDEQSEPVGVAVIERTVNIKRSRLTNMLKVLEVEGVVDRIGAKYRRTDLSWSYPTERIAHITGQRHQEQARMREYLDGTGCLMQHVRAELDDPNPQPCGRCGRCLGRPIIDVVADPDLARRAVTFLRGHSIDIEPRKQWPDLKRIPPTRQAAAAKALCQLGDGGWGTLISEQRIAGAFSDEVVAALATLYRSWRPDPQPQWVTAVPSLRNPDMVASLARRLAAELGLPFREVLAREHDRPAQRTMENSAQQCRNVVGAFVMLNNVPPTPVLLVDDIIDSRWTVAVLADLLRDAGCEAVVPIALAVGSAE